MFVIRFVVVFDLFVIMFVGVEEKTKYSEFLIHSRLIQINLCLFKLIILN